MSSLSLVTSNQLPSVKNFIAYKAYVNNIPSLSAEEEWELLTNFKQHNCLESTKKLILSQLKTVVYIASQFKNYGLPEEDLVQEGNIGLMKSVKNFSLDHKVRLYSYALIWIKAEIQAYVLKNWKLVKIGTTKSLKKLFFNFKSVQKELIDQGVSKQQLAKEISKKLNVDIEDVNDIQNYFNNEDVIIDMDEEDAPVLQIGHNDNPELMYMEKHDSIKLTQALTESLSNLNDKQRRVIELRYFSENKSTHKEIAQEIGISSERVRQIELEAMSKMKKALVKDFSLIS